MDRIELQVEFGERKTQVDLPKVGKKMRSWNLTA